MSDALRELYQALIVDHGRHPRNYATLPEPCLQAYGYNPLCGDKVQVFLQVDAEERIVAVTFQGEGCAISMASASLMTEFVQGKTLEQAEADFLVFQRMLTAETVDDKAVEDLGKLGFLQGVRAFPARVKCATLAWHTLHDACKAKSKGESPHAHPSGTS